MLTGSLPIIFLLTQVSRSAAHKSQFLVSLELSQKHLYDFSRQSEIRWKPEAALGPCRGTESVAQGWGRTASSELSIQKVVGELSPCLKIGPLQ